jgi:4-amino-4-deoxy-L-arabinose transferase-like glycosyltransferase
MYILLALAYAWATPPLEASDELWHVGMVNQIAQTGELPVQVVGTETAWEQEGSQPPLYYLISAALISRIDRSDFDSLRQPNPHAIAGIPGAVGNKNLVLHDTPHSPLIGTVLAVYVLRLFSIALGSVTITAIYQSASLLNGEHRWFPLLAAGLTAFNPMFLFISASVNNDNLVIALDSLVIWQMLVMLRDGFRFRRSLILSVLIALASLSKLSGLVLIPVVVLGALWVAYRTKDWRGLFALAVCIATTWIVLAGWWYVRNHTLYSEWFGTATMAAVAGAREGSFSLGTLLSEFQGFRFSYWALFGAVNIMTFRLFYDLMDVVTLLAIIGVIVYLWRNRKPPTALIPILLLGLTVLLGAIGVIGWTAQTYASQGRLLFPYVGAISPLLAMGFISLIPQMPPRWILVPLAAFGVFALIVPFASIAPEYALPPPLEKLPDSAHQVYARFGDVALIGYETPDIRYAPGDTLPVTVYWQVLERSDGDLSLYLHAIAANSQVVGRVDSYPGAGRLRTTTWMPGAIYADTYLLPLNGKSDPARLRLQVGWWDYATKKGVDPVAEDGTLITSVMLDAGAYAAAQVTQSGENLTAVTDARFGGLIALISYQLQGNNLELEWHVLGSPPADYTVFVQVLDTDNNIIGQGDAPPDMPTHYWRAGEHFITRHTIQYPQTPPAGTYRLMVGWYKPDNFARLDTNAPDDAYPLAEIDIP